MAAGDQPRCAGDSNMSVLMATEQSSLYVVVPVYNEADNLERLFASFRLLHTEYTDRHHVQLVMVADGSTDDTVRLANELGEGLDLTVLSSATNKGPGSAFAMGFEYLASRITDSDWLVTLEGDNTSRRELLRHMFHRVREGYDVVLASPYMYGGGITNTSALRIFISHIANAFVKEFLGVHGIMTVSSFFRLYRGSVIQQLHQYYGAGIIERRGFECMIELLLKMMYLGVTISEVPMVLDTNLRAGKSKMKIMRTILGYIALSRRLKAWQDVAKTAPAVPEPVSLSSVV